MGKGGGGGGGREGGGGRRGGEGHGEGWMDICEEGGVELRRSRRGAELFWVIFVERVQRAETDRTTEHSGHVCRTPPSRRLAFSYRWRRLINQENFRTNKQI